MYIRYRSFQRRLCKFLLLSKLPGRVHGAPPGSSLFLCRYPVGSKNKNKENKPLPGRNTVRMELMEQTPMNDPDTGPDHAANHTGGIFCNRTLNLNSIGAIGYDMDYTLIHYRMEVWERHAYEYIKNRLVSEGWPAGGLVFDPELVMRGLVVDVENGNVVKANRFGYIKRAFHGSGLMDFDMQQRFYRRVLVDLNESRWYFLNTLFSMAETCLYMQLVDLLDAGRLSGCMGYADLHKRLRRSFDAAHMEGRLKAEVIADPDRFVEPDPDIAPALLDQKRAGKKILLISNSEWSYAFPMLSYAFDRYLPGRMTWRDLFDIAIVGARKPDFFTLPLPVFEIATSDGLLRERHGTLTSGRVYVGGSAELVERSLGLDGDQILYVGDHIFADVNITKSILRWRTALIIRELEDEIAETERFEDRQRELTGMMLTKKELEAEHSMLRLELLRTRQGYGPKPGRTEGETEQAIADVRRRLGELDRRLAPLALAAGRLLNPNWGLLMRTGMDKSHFARQVERYADIYTARVSNLLGATPFAFFRSCRGRLPHDPDHAPY